MILMATPNNFSAMQNWNSLRNQSLAIMNNQNPLVDVGLDLNIKLLLILFVFMRNQKETFSMVG